jgi:hypothetical protein
MRIATLIPLLILISNWNPAAANECHALKGKYNCTDTYGDSVPVEIDFPEGGVSLDDDRLSWGAWSELKDNSELVNRRGTAQCENGRLITSFTAVDVNRKKEITGKLDWKTTWTKTASGILANSEGVVTPVAGAPVPMAGEFVCTPDPDKGSQEQCPDLKGKYTCPLHNGPQKFSFDLERLDGKVVYYIDGYPIPADGDARPLPESGLYRNGTLRAYCRAGVLNVELDAEFYPNDQFGGRMKMLMKRSKNTDGSIELVNEGSLQVGGQLLPMRGQGRCSLD